MWAAVVTHLVLLYYLRCAGTSNMAVIDLGKSEATAGLTFVCFSLAKRLLDLPVELMPLDRVSKLVETPTLKVRLNTVAVETFL